MTFKAIPFLCCVLGCFPLIAEEPVSDRPVEAVFHRVDKEAVNALDADKALDMGSYLLEADAVTRLSNIETLRKAINRIRQTDWTVEPWTRKNADLTIRQQMDRYIQSATEYYAGKGRRPSGVVGKRLENLTDIELGDRELSSALMSVQMAAAWSIPLQPGQEERLDAAIQMRLRMLQPQKD